MWTDRDDVERSETAVLEVERGGGQTVMMSRGPRQRYLRLSEAVDRP